MKSPFYIKWIARITAILLFLFWGGFFLEHLVEWFFESEKGLPPIRVWISMAAHFIMMTGLLIMVRWIKTGILTMVISTITFFLIIDFNGFPYIALINLLPVLFFALSGYLKHIDNRK